jgi:demethylmenaquinone methyltransferase/2-methoxy-6-polyprenyl-1,4-benzoquinol methylase
MSQTLEEPRAGVDKSPERVREMFGQIAGRYDLLNHLLSMGTDYYWRWRAVRLVKPQKGKGPILDLCTGTGDLAFAYRKAAGAQVEVVGADFCHPMLKLAREKASSQPTRAGLGFVEADAERLPFGDSLFQIVCVGFGLRNVADTDQGLREMRRVCQPGGRVAVLEFSQPEWEPFRSLYGWYFRNVLPRIGQALARNRHDAYSYLPASVQEFPCGEALCERMRAVGLREVRYVPLTLGVAALYVGVK